LARAGTPQPIVDKLNAALAADFKRSETVDRFRSFGIVAQWDTPSEFAAFITEQSTKWVKVIRAAGIRVTCARTRANLELNSKIQTSV
jgi:tripartite-type tricarboxylate transporter receptor subunit TctC